MMCPYYLFLKFVTKSEERLICYPVLNFVKFSQNNLICNSLSLPASVFQCLHYYCTCYHVYYIHFLRTWVMKIFLLIIHACFTCSEACPAILNLAVIGKDHRVIYHIRACSIWLLFFIEWSSIASQWTFIKYHFQFWMWRMQIFLAYVTWDYYKRLENVLRW
jgi:hypothetical protein